MDGLAAVGAASSIIQLVDFSLKLIAAAKEIRDSLDGSSLKNEAIEDVYRQMKSVLEPVKSLVPVTDDAVGDAVMVNATFFGEMPSGSNCGSNLGQVVTVPTIAVHATLTGRQVLLTVAQTAEDECTEILKHLEKLKLKNGGHKLWGSIVMAFKSTMGQKRIDEIEARLRSQVAMVSIELTKLTWHEVEQLNKNVKELIRQASRSGIDKDPQLEQLSESFAGLATRSGGTDSGTAQSNTKALVNDVETLSKKFTMLRRTALARQAVIDSLHFPSRACRHEAIPQNHKHTFEWIYRTPSFRRWLEEEDDIFWIWGKPGSGKSTLMKFLADNPKTNHCLEEWARPQKSTIAAYYFWNLGSDMQKSLLGLMRTLVFDVLRKSPDTIQSACPVRWQMALENQDVFATQRRYDGEGQWTMEELSETIKRLEQSEDGSIRSRLCFFIDGLDEFDGDHYHVCDLLGSLASLPHVKICLSSRPWNVFRDAFGGDEKRQIAVHALTGGDMERFVRDHLVSHRNWGGGNSPDFRISALEQMSLITEIRDRANGVFLWVALVTKSICNGLRNDDNIHDLRQRLRLLPTDLEDLFKHILDRVDRAYWKKSAEYLWIALHEKSDGLPPEAYYYHERDHENEKYAVEWPIEPRAVDPQAASRRIIAITGGLLEVIPKHNKVTFLHRTVAEFLRSKTISQQIVTRVRPNFDVHLALAKVFTVLFKCCRLRYWRHSYVSQIEFHLANVERRNFESTMCLLGALEQMAQQDNGVQEFKESLLCSRLSSQISRTVSTDPSYFSDIPSPARFLMREHSINDDSVEILRILGQLGQGLNTPQSGSLSSAASPWATYFRSFTINNVNEYIVSYRKLLTIGADPNVQVVYFRSIQSAFSVYLIIPFSCNPGYIALDLDSYLSTLDAFLDHVADFTSPITVRRPDSFSINVNNADLRRWWSIQLDVTSNTVTRLLVDALKQLGHNSEIRTCQSLVFETLKRILSKRSDDTSLMSQLAIVIPQSFPGHLSAILLDMIPPAQREEQSHKRKREEGDSGDPRRLRPARY